MNVRLATNQDKDQWNNFVLSSSQSSFMQTWQWGQMQERLGMKSWRLVVDDGGQIKAVALIIRRDLPFGKCWLYVPRGPIISKSSEASKSSNVLWKFLQDRFIELAEQEKAIFVRVDPAIPEKKRGQVPFLKAKKVPDPFWRKSEREVQPRHTLILDLTKSGEDLMVNMHPKTRYNIRLSERKGVAVRFSTSPKDVDAFLQLSKEVSSRSGFHYHPDEYYRVMTETLGDDSLGERISAELAIAEHEGDQLTVHIMIYAGEVATYIHGASSSKKKNLMGSVRIYWETIRRAKDKGYKTYDFFGVAPEGTDESHPWAGITRVKSGFGGQREDYIGAYDLVLEPGMYGMFNVARRIRGLIR